MVCDFLPKVSLWFAVDANDYPLAFMLIDNGVWKRCSLTQPIAARALVARWFVTDYR